MTKPSVFIVGALVALNTCAATSDARAANDTNDVITLRSGRKITRQELHRKVEISRLRHTGGIIRMENSAKGTLLVLNAQGKVSTDALKTVESAFDKWIPIRMAFRDGQGVSIANVKSSITSSGGTVGVAVIEDAHLPMLVTAPEDGWALVNVAKIAEDKPTAEVLASRVRKEVLRGIAFVTGCAYATRADPLMRDVIKPSDLDALPCEQFGAEIIMKMRDSAIRYGVKPWYVTTYKKACEEGWAPTPTNEYQKAIWDKVHQLPTKPIKILPETKPVKE